MKQKIINLVKKFARHHHPASSYGAGHPGKSAKDASETESSRGHSITASQPHATKASSQKQVPENLQSSPRNEHYRSGREQNSLPPQPSSAPATREYAGIEIAEPIARAIEKLGFSDWTPVQKATLPFLLESRDVAAQAQTGTGKTAAFLVTILNRLLRHPKSSGRDSTKPAALILAPTRELAIQIDNDLKELAQFTGLKHLVVYGGQDYEAQKRRLQNGVEVIAATPGRLLDFSRKKIVDLAAVQTLVLDEADRMLDMGFLPDIRRIINQLPAREKRQNMLFSATLDPRIMRLANQWMNAPERVEIAPDNLVAKEVEHFAYVISREDKLALLLWLLNNQAGERVLVFRNRRVSSEKLAKTLIHYGVNCALLSGDVNQNKRLRVLEAFRKGTIRVIVATDVAGRGIHVENISHVINYDIPDEADAYVHRIGRTGRAGVSGQAVSFACEDGGFMIPQIEEYLGEPIRMLHPEQEMLKLPHPVRQINQHQASESLTGEPKSRKPRNRRSQSRPRRPRR